MVTKVSYDVKPGGLSAQDHERIFALAEKGFKTARIARILFKHPSTVGWFMYRHGLIKPSRSTTREPYFRKGLLVRPFSEVEDRFILDERIDGATFQQLAAMIEERFGYRRSAHAIQNRLTMLAGFEEAEADARLVAAE